MGNDIHTRMMPSWHIFALGLKILQGVGWVGFKIEDCFGSIYYRFVW